LLSVPVEHYERWNVGLWIEVTKPDFDRVMRAWDDPRLYADLRFSGRVANDLVADLDLPLASGSQVELHVPAADAPPQIEAPPSGALAARLATPWPRAAFEAYAVARHFL
jgi:hypothetical protein